MGDIPHQIKCEKCGREFWTGVHRSTGICKTCNPQFGDEMSPEQANEVLNRMFPKGLPIISSENRDGSEGELKKQIKKWLTTFTPNVVAKEMEAELMTIIDKAAAEFPFCCEPNHYTKNPTRCPCNEWAKQMFGEKPNAITR